METQEKTKTIKTSSCLHLPIPATCAARETEDPKEHHSHSVFVQHSDGNECPKPKKKKPRGN